MKIYLHSGIVALALMTASCAKHVVPVATFIPPAPRALSAPPQIIQPPLQEGMLLAELPVWVDTLRPTIATPMPLPRPPKPVVVQRPEPSVPPEPPPSNPPPMLVQLLTKSEQDSYTRQIEDSLKRVQDNLRRLAGKRLNGAQRITLERVQAFVKQAEEIKSSDLVTARSLSQRADVLARDLIRTLQP